MRNWDWSLIGIIALMAIIIIGGLLLILQNDSVEQRQRDKFMTACMKDKKEYECTAMWRAGESHSSTTVVPMPVIVGK